MRRVFIVVVLIIAAAVLGLWRTHGGVRQGLRSAVGMPNDSSQGDARDEIRRSFQMQPGDRVEVQGINGPVTIETSDIKTAEVYVLRTATSSDSLSRREVVVEQTGTGLSVRGREARHAGLWEHMFGRNPKEEVRIKAPRDIALSVRGVNGPVNTGDIDGSIEAKGINGRVQFGSTNDFADLAGINGNVSVGLKKLGERGARFNGINGNIELRLGTDINADLSAKGMNGNVRSEITAVTVDKEQYGHYSARIGNGGASISFSGINGNVRLTRAEGEVGKADTVDKKSAAATSQSAKPEKSSAPSKTSKDEQ
jgi:hypothetical protein